MMQVSRGLATEADKPKENKIKVTRDQAFGWIIAVVVVLRSADVLV